MEVPELLAIGLRFWTSRAKRFTHQREDTLDPRTLSATAYSHIRSRRRRL
jgi:hypothetical protein